MAKRGKTSKAAQKAPHVPSNYEILVRELYCSSARLMGEQYENYGLGAMPTWDGGEDIWGRQCSPIWPKIVSLLVIEEADPFLFMQAQFDGCVKPPLPTALKTPEAMVRYRKYAVGLVDRTRNGFASGKMSIAARVQVLLLAGHKEATAVAYAIDDTVTVDATPVVRYTVAVLEGLPTVAANWLPKAVDQYAFQATVIKRAIGKMLPRELVEQGDLVREHLLQLAGRAKAD